jgi:hypothetical protein
MDRRLIPAQHKPCDGTTKHRLFNGSQMAKATPEELETIHRNKFINQYGKDFYAPNVEPAVHYILPELSRDGQPVRVSGIESGEECDIVCETCFIK